MVNVYSFITISSKFLIIFGCCFVRLAIKVGGAASKMELNASRKFNGPETGF